MKELFDNYMLETTISANAVSTNHGQIHNMNTMPSAMSCNDCVIDMIGLAQAYVPYQTNTSSLSENCSLALGTMFVDLVDPYVRGTALAITSGRGLSK